jgi:predicted GNAT family N-acyltransferase
MKHIKLFEQFIFQNLEKDYGVILDLWDNGDYLELGRIIVPKDDRKTGVGSKVMKKIIDYADSIGKDIRLTPSTDFGGTSVNRLKAFYSRFGFVNNKDYAFRDSMVRYAKN